MKYRLGVDVGGTNTDAIIIDENLDVVSSVKSPTTEDIYQGIINAIRAVLKESAVDKSSISMAMLGTTQCTNAIVERKRLSSFAVLRIGAPASVGIPSMVDWDDELKSFCVASAIISGGFEYDGKQLAAFDEEAARVFFESVKGKTDSIAISSVFASVRNDHEKKAAEIARSVLGEDVHLSISSEIGSMGLIERENATILNAALCKVAQSFTDGFEMSLRKEGICNATIYLSQNDGTLMTMDYARRYPILTIACGPTNSIRGASYLSKCNDAIVVDVGGTTTDIGSLQNGFPRESGVAVTIGGVRTNFRMPDVISIGIGGGSIVRKKEDGTVTVGPDSVGYNITRDALVFGGGTLTATDIAVRLGLCNIGDRSKVSSIPLDFAKKAQEAMILLVEDAIDSMKLSSDDVDVVLVGGGAVILPEHLKGAARVLKPSYSPVANAIGCAISKVSGTYEKLINYDEIPRDKALDMAKKEAVRMAVSSGAAEDTVEIIDVEDVPLQYYPGNTVRIKIKAAGELD